MTASGYAAVAGDEILVQTVSQHERGAMVNWLVVFGKYHVSQGMGDFAIRDAFYRLTTTNGVKIVRVTIED